MTERAINGFLEEHGIRYFRAGQDRLWSRLEPPRELWGLAIPTLRVLDWLRERVGPITVLSGYRDPTHNARVGGAKNSLHLRFNAFDVSSRSTNPRRLSEILAEHPWYQVVSVGVYPSFIHVDTRSLATGAAPWRNTEGAQGADP